MADDPERGHRIPGPVVRIEKRERGNTAAMNFWLVLAVNSITFGGLLFLLSAGFSLIFGLMRIPNLTHGSLFMLGAYFGATFVGGLLGFEFEFLAGGAPGGAAGRRVRRPGRAAAAAPAARRATGAGAGHARPVVHGRRFLPDGLGRRPDQRRHARRAWRLRPRRRGGVSDLSAGDHRHRRRGRHRRSGCCSTARGLAP